MRRSLRALYTIGALVALLLTILSQPKAALAHERRTIAGKYDVVVGWDKEPAFVNQPNAAGITVYQAGTQNPVEGLEKTLKISIAFGGREGKEFPLNASDEVKGHYTADIIPTRS